MDWCWNEHRLMVTGWQLTTCTMAQPALHQMSFIFSSSIYSSLVAPQYRGEEVWVRQWPW